MVDLSIEMFCIQPFVKFKILSLKFWIFLDLFWKISDEIYLKIISFPGYATFGLFLK